MMKRMLMLILTITVLCSTVVAPVGAVNSELTQMPALTDYYLYDYADGEVPIIFQVGEAGFSQDKAIALTEEIDLLMASVPFIPLENSLPLTEELVLNLAFQHKTDNDLLVFIEVRENGIIVTETTRSQRIEYAASIQLDTQEVIAGIKSIMNDTVKLVEQNRVQQEQQEQEIRSQYETELTSFQKLYTLNVPELTLTNFSTIELPFEFGICSYMTAEDDAENYAYYFDIDNKGTLRLAQQVNFDNAIVFYDLQIYQDDKNNQKYYLYTKNRNVQTHVKVLPHIGTDGKMEKLDISINSFEGSVDRNQFHQRGTLKNYGSLKLPLSSGSETQLPEDTYEPEKQDTKEEKDDKPEKQDPTRYKIELRHEYDTHTEDFYIDLATKFNINTSVISTPDWVKHIEADENAEVTFINIASTVNGKYHIDNPAVKIKGADGEKWFWLSSAEYGRLAGDLSSGLTDDRTILLRMRSCLSFDGFTVIRNMEEYDSLSLRFVFTNDDKRELDYMEIDFGGQRVVKTPAEEINYVGDCKAVYEKWMKGGL